MRGRARAVPRPPPQRGRAAACAGSARSRPRGCARAHGGPRYRWARASVPTCGALAPHPGIRRRSGGGAGAGAPSARRGRHRAGARDDSQQHKRAPATVHAAKAAAQPGAACAVRSPRPGNDRGSAHSARALARPVCARSAPDWCARDCSGSARGWGERPFGRVSAAPYGCSIRPIRARFRPDLCAHTHAGQHEPGQAITPRRRANTGGFPLYPPLSL